MAYRLLPFVFAALLALPAEAQSDYHYKDTATATLFGVLIPGGGHLYAGDTQTGAVLLGFGAGWPALGTFLTSQTGDYLCEGVGTDQTCRTEYNELPMLVGGAAGIAAWMYGFLTADDAARRHNEQLGITLAPTREQPGLALRVEL